jgi:hypothetical protein
MLHSNYTVDYTTWEPLPRGGGVLVQDVNYKGDAAADALADVPEAAWRPTDLRFRVNARGTMLFDGSWPGTEAGESGMEIDLQPGEYAVDAIPEFAHGDVVARYVRLTPRRGGE